MKNGILFLLILFLVGCSESSSSPEQVLPSEDASLVAISETARDYLFDSLGMKEVKIVFRNDDTENLGFVRFAEDTTVAVEFVSDLDVYHPMISPDGKWVAFSTCPEPIPRSSKIYVQSLETNSRLELDALGTVPRWRVVDGDTVLIFTTSSGVNDDDAYWNSQGTWMVSFQKGKFGVPRQILSGFFHGGVSDDLRLAVTGSHYLRVHSELPGNVLDTVWYDSAQVCNVSLSTDGSRRTLFLDLGAERGREFSGEDYEPHHRILIADSLGKLTSSIPSPEWHSFDFPEWVYGSDRFVSVIAAQNAHQKLALLDIRDSSVHVLLSGEELWHPDIWLSK